MTRKHAELVRVRLEQTPENWTVATCEQIPGLFISNPDLNQVLEDIPPTIQALYKAQWGVDVVVIVIEDKESSGRAGQERPYVAIPTEVLAAARSR